MSYKNWELNNYSRLPGIYFVQYKNNSDEKINLTIYIKAGFVLELRDILCWTRTYLEDVPINRKWSYHYKHHSRCFAKLNKKYYKPVFVKQARRSDGV